MLYDEILNNDPRYQTANQNAKRGSAYSGWAPKPRSRLREWIADLTIVGFALILVIVAMKGLGL